MSPTLKERIGSHYREGHFHEVGTEVQLVKALDPQRRFWIVEVRVPDDSLEGGAWYETLELEWTQINFGTVAHAPLRWAGCVKKESPARARPNCGEAQDD